MNSNDEIYYKKIFSNNLRKYMTLNKKIQADLINDLNLSSSTISNWCTGLKLPRMDKIQMLADYFNIQISDLLEDKPVPTISSKDNLYFLDIKLAQLGYTICGNDDDYIWLKHQNKSFEITMHELKKLDNDTKEYLLFRLQQLENHSEHPNHLEVNTAHERTDIEVDNEMIQHDNDIMDNF